MLIYNHKKEFLGIDEQDLTSLGFSTLSELKEEAEDIAELFVKEPGHIHNFKHVHWIDFAECSDSIENSKVIIKTSSKNFKCHLEIKTAYLNDNPEEKAFLVYLQNLKEVSVNENGEVIETPLNTTAPTIPIVQEEFTKTMETTKHPQEEHVEDEFPEDEFSEDDFKNDVTDEFQNDGAQEDHVPEEEHEQEVDDAPINLDLDAPLNIELDDHEPIQQEESQKEDFDESYVYDPHVASSELGLPVELITEFIQDFIDQAREFKPNLYSSFESGDTATFRSLAHKLKGVAANLRIEDALEALTIINTSDNQTEVKSYLDDFYIIISRLAGERSASPKNIKKAPTPSKEEPEVDDSDELVIDFKYDDDEKQEEDEPLDVESAPDKKENDDIDVGFENNNDYIKIEIPEEEEPHDEIHIELEDDDEYKVEAPKEIEQDAKQDETALEDEIKAPQIEENEDTLNENPVKYDKKTAAKDIGLDDESFQELFDDYINEAKELSSEISSAVKNEDPDLWSSHASHLKRMSDNMRIEECSEELETLINTKDVEEAKKAAEKLDSIVSKISNIES